jgi:small subunit ribosomal protein S4
VARYTGPVCRLCRREGRKLYLKGERCNSPKCAVAKRAYPPGQKGSGMRRGKVSTYGLQLRAKQEAKRTYGVLEKQFRRYFQIADRTPGITGTALMQLLERRLDNIVYRLGFARSRAAARELVSHGHVLVNGRRLDVASALVKAGQTIALSPKMSGNATVQASLEYAGTVGRLEWLDWDPESKRGTLLAVPQRGQIPSEIKEQMIVELYSK